MALIDWAGLDPKSILYAWIMACAYRTYAPYSIQAKNEYHYWYNKYVMLVNNHRRIN